MVSNQLPRLQGRSGWGSNIAPYGCPKAIQMKIHNEVLYLLFLIRNIGLKCVAVHSPILRGAASSFALSFSPFQY